MKPKENKGTKVGTYDNCFTPPYALEPLLPYLNPITTLWECADSSGTLSRYLTGEGFNVLSTSIIDEQLLYYPDYISKESGDFFEIEPIDRNYTIITNPPYSIKYRWLDRCMELDRPFALLLPVETLGAKAAQKYINNLQVMLLQPRVDFLMPEKGYEGGGAQFPTAWFTYGLNLPSQLTVGYLNKPKRSELGEYWRKALDE